MYRKLRKGLCLIFLSVLIIFQTLFPNFVIADDADMEIYYDNVVSNVQAGESVVYRLNVRVTGFNAAAKQKSRKLVITLPGGKEGMTTLDTGGYDSVEKKLKSMAITLPTDTTDSGTIDIVPKFVTTNDGTQLEYDFESYLQSGVSYSIEIPLRVANGIIHNGQKLTPHALYYEDDKQVKDITLPQSTVSSDTSVSISKTYLYAEGHENDKSYTPKNGDILVWQIKANSPYQPFGLAYIKPGTNITITDKIEGNYHEYDSASDGGSYSNGTVTWNIAAPSQVDQSRYDRAETQNIFEKTVTVKTKVKNINVSEEVKNKASISLQNISNQTKKADSNEVNVLATGSNGGQPGTSEEGYLIGYTVGPKDGDGGIQEVNNINDMLYSPNPAVSGSATLGFGIYYRVTPMATIDYDNKKIRRFYADKGELPFKLVNGGRESRRDNYPVSNIYKTQHRNITVNRYVDNNLELDYILLGLPVQWGLKPNDDPLRFFRDYSTIPKTTIKLEIDGKGSKYVPISYKNLMPDPSSVRFNNAPLRVMKLTREDLGLEPSDHVSQYKVFYGKTDQDNNSVPTFSGAFAVDIYDFYKPKVGYSGGVSNSANYNLELANGDRYARIPDYSMRRRGAIGERTAVIKSDIEYKTSINTNVEFEKREGNTVNLGENTVKFSMNANYPTPANAIADSTSTLLPLGVTVDRSKWNSKTIRHLDANGNVLENMNNEVEVVDNFNGTGRQLVRVKWNGKILTAKQALEVRVPVTVSKDTDKQFTIPVYATVDNKDFDTIPPTSKVRDNMDINGKNGTNDNMATNTTQYVLINRNDLKIEKFVKGNVDEGYSKLGYATIGGTAEYRLQLTNTSGEKIKKMGFIDILPSIGDTGVISTGSSRGSKFTPTMVGPITLPAEWRDKVDVFYSTATNPKRDDFDSKVDYPSGASHIVNPAGATDPNWQTASQVGNNWSNIHSFKIDLKPGVEWIEGQHIVVTFTMKMPLPKNNEEKNSDVFTGKGNNADRAAWNSFAVTTNGLLPVEPERVGVALMPPLHFKVLKKDQFGNSLKTGTMDLKFWIDKVEGNTRNFYSGDGKNINLSTTNPFTFNQQLDNASTYDEKGNARTKITYVVTEERAPVGYKKTNNKYYVEMDVINRTVTWTKTVDENGKETQINKLLYNEQDADNEVELEIENTKQVLPKTGGYGALLYILIGGSLILIANRIKKRNIDLGEK